jgi:hypothetical protein
MPDYGGMTVNERPVAARLPTATPSGPFGGLTQFVLTLELTDGRQRIKNRKCKPSG